IAHQIRTVVELARPAVVGRKHRLEGTAALEAAGAREFPSADQLSSQTRAMKVKLVDPTEHQPMPGVKIGQRLVEPCVPGILIAYGALRGGVERNIIDRLRERIRQIEIRVLI